MISETCVSPSHRGPGGINGSLEQRSGSMLRRKTDMTALISDECHLMRVRFSRVILIAEANILPRQRNARLIFHRNVPLRGSEVSDRHDAHDQTNDHKSKYAPFDGSGRFWRHGAIVADGYWTNYRPLGETQSSLNRYRWCESQWSASSVHLSPPAGLGRRTMPVVCAGKRQAAKRRPRAGISPPAAFSARDRHHRPRTPSSLLS
jgi:hypothetical protein